MVSGGKKRHQDKRAKAIDGHSAYPVSQLFVSHSNLSHKKSRHDKIINSHAVSQQIEVYLPTNAGASLSSTMKWETSFYYEVHTSIAMFMSPRFIREYILQGYVSMILKNVPIDAENTAMLLPSGELLLLIDTDTYEQLGLVGQNYGEFEPSSCKHTATLRKRRRHVVRIDLKLPMWTSTEPDPKRDRVVHCVTTAFSSITMLVCAYNERGACRTILFSDDDTMERKRIDVTGQQDLWKEVLLPRMSECIRANEDRVEGSEHEKRALQSVYDWLGFVACRVNTVLDPSELLEPYLSAFTNPAVDLPHDSNQILSTVRWCGMLTSTFVNQIFTKLRGAVHHQSVPWAVITVWGFEDTIVSWRQDEKKENGEHGYLVNGCNQYTFLIIPSDEYVVYQQVGPHDTTV